MRSLRFHKCFKLNGNSFQSEEELLEFAEKLSESTYNFFLNWFSSDDFVVVRTSGSTGKPKKIKLQKNHMKNSALATGEFFNLYNNTIALCCLSTNFIAGRMMLVRALVLGWHIDVVEPNSNPLKTISKDYDFSAMVPLQVQNSLKKIPLIKTLIIGGGIVSDALQNSLKNISTEVFATYGMTETVTHIAVKRLNHFLKQSLEKINFQNECVHLDSYYSTLPNVSISVDKRNCLIIDAPKISTEKVITNDTVELISNHQFIWRGRFDNVINSGGIKLHPEEIEKKITHIINSRFFVAGIPDEKLGEKLILVIEYEKNNSDQVESSHEKNQIDILIQNNKLLSKFEKPKEIYFVSKFIETDTKKIQRQKTLDMMF